MSIRNALDALPQATPGQWVASRKEVYSETMTGAIRCICICSENNTRPIAAAPDLLLHLKRLVAAIDRMPANAVDGLADEVRAAIAKAEGRQ